MAVLYKVCSIKSAPVYSQVFLCVGEGCTDTDTNIIHYNHITLAFLTGFLFATHLPERLAPGSFDYIGKTVPATVISSGVIVQCN